MIFNMRMTWFKKAFFSNDSRNYRYPQGPWYVLLPPAFLLSGGYIMLFISGANAIQLFGITMFFISYYFGGPPMSVLILLFATAGIFKGFSVNIFAYSSAVLISGIWLNILRIQEDNFRGLLISFEGIDGTGKSTQINLAAEHLERRGIPYIITREPGGTDLGTELRNILLNSKSEISGKAELYIFMADRSQHLESVIMPALAQGKVVLCDRYFDASRAYQRARGVDLEFIDRLHKDSGFPSPALTFLFDLPGSAAAERTRTREISCFDRFESEGVEFQNKIRDSYLALTVAEPKRFKIINAQRDIETINFEIVQLLEKAIKNWSRN